MDRAITGANKNKSKVENIDEKWLNRRFIHEGLLGGGGVAGGLLSDLGVIGIGLGVSCGS